MLLHKFGKVHTERLLAMAELYNRINALCESNRITITTMCKQSGANRASLTDLKVGRKQGLSTDTLSKIADYFDTTIDYLSGRTDDRENSDRLGIDDAAASSADHPSPWRKREKALVETGERAITYDDFTYAMQNEAAGLTEDDKTLLLSMARQLNAARKKKENE